MKILFIAGHRGMVGTALDIARRHAILLHLSKRTHHHEKSLRFRLL